MSEKQVEQRTGTIKIVDVENQTSKNVQMESGDTVRDALEQAGVDATGRDINVNGNQAGLDTVLGTDSFVVVSGEVQNG